MKPLPELRGSQTQILFFKSVLVSSLTYTKPSLVPKNFFCSSLHSNTHYSIFYNFKIIQSPQTNPTNASACKANNFFAAQSEQRMNNNQSKRTNHALHPITTRLRHFLLLPDGTDAHFQTTHLAKTTLRPTRDVLRIISCTQVNHPQRFHAARFRAVFHNKSFLFLCFFFSMRVWTIFWEGALLGSFYLNFFFLSPCAVVLCFNFSWH